MDEQFKAILQIELASSTKLSFFATKSVSQFIETITPEGIKIKKPHTYYMDPNDARFAIM